MHHQQQNHGSLEPRMPCKNVPGTVVLTAAWTTAVSSRSILEPTLLKLSWVHVKTLVVSLYSVGWDLQLWGSTKGLQSVQLHPSTHQVFPSTALKSTGTLTGGLRLFHQLPEPPTPKRILAVLIHCWGTNRIRNLWWWLRMDPSWWDGTEILLPAPGILLIPPLWAAGAVATGLWSVRHSQVRSKSRTSWMKSYDLCYERDQAPSVFKSASPGK